MKSFLPMLLVAGSLAGSMFGQSPACPTVSVEGPQGIPKPGESIRFAAQVDVKAASFDFQYHWTASKGRIVAGQGTSAIEVIARLEEGITVTVEVKGLPEGCNRFASETAISCPSSPTLLDEFEGSLTGVADLRYEEILDHARKDQSAQLYIIISGKRGDETRSKRTKATILTHKIVKRFGPDDGRVTYVYSDRQDDRVLVYLVPAGATPPDP